MSPACVPRCFAFEECPSCFFAGSDRERERVAALEAFVRDFKEAVDSGAIKPVHTGPFAKLCYDACRLVPSASKVKGDKTQ